MFWLLITSVVSRQTISQVFTGTWDANMVYASDNSTIPPLRFEVVHGEGANYLETLFDDNLAQINLSYTNLSGNVTYMDAIYDFDFTMKVPPFVSCNVDAGELGIFHVTLASYTNIHAVYVTDGRVLTFLLNKYIPPAQGNWLWNLILRNKTGVFGVSAFIVIQLVFRYAVSRLQANAAREMAQKRATEAESKAKEKNEEEEEENDVKKERVADEDGKVKTE